LPDDLFERAQLWANQTERPVADFLMETIEASLLPLGQVPSPVDEWTNDEVLSAIDGHMSPDDDQRLSELLARQRDVAILPWLPLVFATVHAAAGTGLLLEGLFPARRPKSTDLQKPAPGPRTPALTTDN
jgi:hypothetical protein